MTEPTGPARDSSLQDRKAPGNLTPDAPRSPAGGNVIGPDGVFHLNISSTNGRFETDHDIFSSRLSRKRSKEGFDVVDGNIARAL